MRTQIVIAIILTFVFAAKAQDFNPFESIGKPGKMLTLSNGKYTEIHINDSLQRIGSVIVNTRSGMIHEILNTDTLYSESTLDPTVISRWYSLDPKASKYPSVSPYAFTANNPIWYVEIDGAEFDLSNLSEGQKARYTAQITLLKEDKVFNYYYNVLEKSATVYTITETPEGTYYNGAFYPPPINRVDVKDLDRSYVLAQELFHAFQNDLITQGVIYQEGFDQSRNNAELEGDVVSFYVAQSVGVGAPSDEWMWPMTDKYFEHLTLEEVSSQQFKDVYKQMTVERYDYYLDRAKNEENGFKKYASYLTEKHDLQPEAYNKVLREVDANDRELQGPRLENGNYYEN